MRFTDAGEVLEVDDELALFPVGDSLLVGGTRQSRRARSETTHKLSHVLLANAGVRRRVAQVETLGALFEADFQPRNSDVDVSLRLSAVVRRDEVNDLI